MTLKSLNTRYVKLIRKTAVMGIGLMVIVSLLGLTRWCAQASGFNRRPAEADNSIPPLKGAAAITYLQKRKLYDSLRAALKAARTGSDAVTIPLLVDEQKLTASDGAARDSFGQSVAISGSTVVVGALNSNSFQGSAYVFDRQGGSWVETQKLTASDGAAGDRFGQSVAISGSTVVVGAIGNNTFQGSAYVFNRQGGSWVEEQKLTASDGAARDFFGISVAVSGSTIVVGADGSNFRQGSAYVFNRQGGSWVEKQKLIASDGAGGNIFGWSVAISGSTIVVSAWGDTVGANLNQGSAYVFNRQGGSWVEEQKLTASDGVAFDELGWSVAIIGSTIVVGSEVEAIGGNDAQGSVYVFNRQGGKWVETQKLTASDGAPQDRFGWSVAVSGSTVVVGAVGGNSFRGSAYVF